MIPECVEKNCITVNVLDCHLSSLGHDSRPTAGRRFSVDHQLTILHGHQGNDDSQGRSHIFLNPPELFLFRPDSAKKITRGWGSIRTLLFWTQFSPSWKIPTDLFRLTEQIPILKRSHQNSVWESENNYQSLLRKIPIELFHLTERTNLYLQVGKPGEVTVTCKLLGLQRDCAPIPVPFFRFCLNIPWGNVSLIS